jgi:hypothetical protein
MLAFSTGLPLAEIQNMTGSERKVFVETFNEKLSESKKD